MSKVNMLEAKTHLSRLVESIESGAETEVIIARNGKPVARLVPMSSPSVATRRLGIAEGLYPPVSLEEFNQDDKEIAALFRNGPLLPEDSQR